MKDSQTNRRMLNDEDLQAILRFFETQAVAHLSKFNTLPPACVLAWLKPDRPQVESVHQFPANEVEELLRTDAGKQKLASAIRGLLDGEGADAAETPAPHVVVQVLVTAVPEGEALLLLVHTPSSAYAIALPKAPNGLVVLPKVFDLVAAQLHLEA